MDQRQEALLNLQVLLYTCILLKTVKPYLVNPLTYAAHQRRQRVCGCVLRAERVSVKTIQQQHQQQQQQQNSTRGHSELDLNAVILVGGRTALNLGLRNGEWRRVIFSNHRKRVLREFPLFGEGERLVRVLFSPGVSAGACLVSPVLYHNAGQGNGTANGPVRVHFVDCWCWGRGEQSDVVRKVLGVWNVLQARSVGCRVSPPRPPPSPSLPNPAKEIHVKVIRSEKYKYGSGELEVLLKDYFGAPRIVALGDTLPLPVPSHLSHEFTPAHTIVPPKSICIKVVRVVGLNGETSGRSCCVSVVAGSTSLYLAGNARSSALPPVAENFRDGEIDVPPVLRDPYVRLRRVIESLTRGNEEGGKGLSDLEKGGRACDVEREEKERDNTYPTFKTRKSKEETKPEKEGDSNYPTEPPPAISRTGEGNHIKGITVLLLCGPGQGSEVVVESAASAVGLGTVWVNCWQVKGDTSGATEAKVRQVFARAASLGPCVLVLQDVHSLSKDRDGEEDMRVAAALREEAARLCCEDPSVVLVGTAPNRQALTDDLWSVWSYQECVGLPDLKQRCDMINWILPSPPFTDQQTLTLAQRTAGYVLGDFVALVNNAKRQSLKRQAAKEEKEGEECQGQGGREHHKQPSAPPPPPPSPPSPHLQYSDLLQALDELQSSRSEALGAPHIPQVQWGEVGGLEGAKRQIINTIQLPLSYPSLVAKKLRQSGVLLYGPPGTGKTLLAKAVATECGLNFLSVKGPELLNMYVGQSEENVRQVFKRAHQAAPCVVFFDELDSLAPNRGHTGDSGGVMDRIVSALLAELDGVAADSADVFVLGATNRPDLLDPALLRPGRFEKLVFVGVCEDHEGQVKILKAVTSKIPLSPSVSLERVSSHLPLTLTGADIYALVTDALYTALHRSIRDVRSGLMLQEGEEGVLVTEEDLKIAAKTIIPSVSQRELKHYHSLNTNHR